MSITLKQRMAHYSKIRARVDLSDSEKVLVEYLLIHCFNADTHKCHPGGETIAAALGWELRKVKRVRAKLKTRGVVAWKSGKTGWSNEYWFPGLAMGGDSTGNVTGTVTDSKNVPGMTASGEPKLTPTGVKSDTRCQK